MHTVPVAVVGVGNEGRTLSGLRGYRYTGSTRATLRITGPVQARDWPHDGCQYRWIPWKEAKGEEHVSKHQIQPEIGEFEKDGTAKSI